MLAEAKQIELLKGASVAERFARVRSLSQTVIELSRRALRRRRPELSEPELALRFVALCYGEELAKRLERQLAERQL
ncbi:MAG: hypothetical protein RBU30_19630 [Polyangia bacterium]|jgi:hypothetical protein|nr:hypothetical protein [Polyangia bacterium]